MTHAEFANDVVHYTTLNDKKVSPYNTTLGSRKPLILKPTSTPSSTPNSTISNSLVLICNCKHAQPFNARIHRLDDTTKLEVSTLASSTFKRKRSTSKLSLSPSILTLKVELQMAMFFICNC